MSTFIHMSIRGSQLQSNKLAKFLPTWQLCPIPVVLPPVTVHWLQTILPHISLSNSSKRATALSSWDEYEYPQVWGEGDIHLTPIHVQETIRGQLQAWVSSFGLFAAVATLASLRWPRGILKTSSNDALGLGWEVDLRGGTGGDCPSNKCSL